MNTNLINLVILKGDILKAKLLVILRRNLVDGKSIVEISCSERIDSKNILVPEIKSFGDFLCRYLIFASNVGLTNKFVEASLNLFFRVLFIVDIVSFEQGKRFNFDLSKTAVLGNDCAFGVLRTAVPTVELGDKILFVDLLEPRLLDFIHANIHCDEPLVDGRDVIKSFFFQKVNFTHNLSIWLRSDDGNDFAKYFFRSLVDDFKINFILVNAPVSVLAFCHNVPIQLSSFYSSEPLDSFVEFDHSSVKLFISFYPRLLNLLNLQVIVINPSAMLFTLKYGAIQLRLFTFIDVDHWDGFWSDSVQWKKIFSQIFLFVFGFSLHGLSSLVRLFYGEFRKLRRLALNFLLLLGLNGFFGGALFLDLHCHLLLSFLFFS